MSLPQLCVHQLFEAQAARTPRAIAVEQGTTQLTYAELNQCADRLARRLRAAGVTRETLVGLCSERSLEAMVALLAILKAGGAYLPLDLAYPPARLALLLDDARPPVLLCSEAGAAALPHAASLPGTRLSLAGCADPSAEGDATPLANVNEPGDAIYVLYTSGSTGKPKGVVALHRGVVRLVHGQSYAAFDAEQVFLQLAPLSFDASTLEIWGPLLHGGKLAVLPGAHPSLEEEISAAIARHGVTTLWLTAGLFHLMVDERLEALRPLRQLLAGGDVLSPSHVRKLLRALPSLRLVNGYGPTETTTFACCHVLSEALPEGRPVPIGKPIAHTTAFLLDEAGAPAPAGAAAELYVGGAGVARGYLGEPLLTAQKFVPNPFGEGTLYRTGDLARWLPDGTLDFLGRVDAQVKIRGFRIEPGEVEAALHAHPAVQQAVVDVREPAPGDKRLVAWIVSTAPEVTTREALRSFLAARVPEHLVPSAFVLVERLPVTANGKVDRKSLPLPAAPAASNGPHAAPAPGLEADLAAIWREVLRAPAVGLDDNFFDLGGSSLHLLDVHARLSRLGKQLPVTALFQFTTIRALAGHLRAGAAAGGSSTVAVQERAARQRAAQARAQQARGKKP